jgi:hypothetical protein
VRHYNDPIEPRAFESYVVHMHMAWLYLLQAEFIRDGVEFRYHDRVHPTRYERVNGEYKRWELSRCVQDRWPDDSDPVRKNLEFFVELRNRIEHRHASVDTALTIALGGHAHALLLNFDEELTSQLGTEHSLATVLKFPVFIGTFTREGEQILRRVQATLPAELAKFIAEFHDGLTDQAAASEHFRIRLQVVLEQVKRGAESMAIQFVRWDDLTEDQKTLVSELGTRGQTVVREQSRPVVGHGLVRAGDATKRVSEAIPFKFNSRDFMLARRRAKIRPENGDPHPERTDEKYCMYVEVSDQYGYTEAWVKRLIRLCSTAKGFENATGRAAVQRTATGDESATSR